VATGGWWMCPASLLTGDASSQFTMRGSPTPLYGMFSLAPCSCHAAWSHTAVLILHKHQASHRNGGLYEALEATASWPNSLSCKPITQLKETGMAFDTLMGGGGPAV